MLRTKVLSVSGLVLTLTSLLMGSGVLGYQRAVIMMQVGGLALVLGLFFRLTKNEPRAHGAPLAGLYDLES